MKPIHESKINQAIIDFLTCFPFFNDLNELELEFLGDHIHFYMIGQGEMLFHEGDIADCMYFLIDGELDVIKESVGGGKRGIDRVVISTLYKGSSLGEMSIFQNDFRSTSIKARTQAHVVTLTKYSFDQIVKNRPEIAVKLLIGLFQMVGKYLRKSTSLLADCLITESG